MNRFIIYLLFFVIISCSTISIEEFNEPLKKELLLNSYRYEHEDEMFKESRKEYFASKLKIRNRIIDSLDILKAKDIIVVDAFSLRYQGEVETDYFFYDNKSMAVRINGNGTYKIIGIDETSNDISELYSYFKSGNISEEVVFTDLITINDMYNVTIARKGKVKYYKVFERKLKKI